MPWLCQICTLNNEDLHLMCDTCGHSRNPDPERYELLNCGGEFTIPAPEDLFKAFSSRQGKYNELIEKMRVTPEHDPERNGLRGDLDSKRIEFAQIALAYSKHLEVNKSEQTPFVTPETVIQMSEGLYEAGGDAMQQ